MKLSSLGVRVWIILTFLLGSLASSCFSSPLPQSTSAQKAIYDVNADAREEIRHALAAAAKTRKRVILVFGANWCYDCHVLDSTFHRSDCVAILKTNFEVVHVNIGEGDKNQDLMQQYGVPMKRGIPGLAVLDSSGKILFSQKNGEFSNARAIGTEPILNFLNMWKAPAR